MKFKKVIKVLAVISALLMIVIGVFVALNWDDIKTLYWHAKGAVFLRKIVEDKGETYKTYRHSSPELAIAALKKEKKLLESELQKFEHYPSDEKLLFITRNTVQVTGDCAVYGRHQGWSAVFRNRAANYP